MFPLFSLVFNNFDTVSDQRKQKEYYYFG